MMYKDLRKKLIEHPKMTGCDFIPRSPIINDAYIGCFNLSFVEHPLLVKFNSYNDFPHDYIFSTIQTCIRPNDLFRSREDDMWRYLGIFEVGDLNGMIVFAKKPDFNVLQKNQIGVLLNLLKDFGIKLDNIYPTYCPGGLFKNLSNGKYDINRILKEDRISMRTFLELGVPQQNLISDTSRNTFLSLRLKALKSDSKKAIDMDSLWGYRNEINIRIKVEGRKYLLDVGTLEYLLYEPVIDNGQIIDFVESKCGASVMGIGIERLCMVVNELEKIQDVDYIKPIYDMYKDMGNSLTYKGFESLRALHRVYADIESGLCKMRKNVNAKYANKMAHLINSLGLEESQVRELLYLNAELQPWHPDLKNGHDSLIEKLNRVKK